MKKKYMIFQDAKADKGHGANKEYRLTYGEYWNGKNMNSAYARSDTTRNDSTRLNMIRLIFPLAFSVDIVCVYFTI